MNDSSVLPDLRTLLADIQFRLQSLELAVGRIAPQPSDMLTTHDVNTVYGVPQSTLFQLAREGRIRKRRIGRKTWWWRDEIAAYLRGER